MIFSNQTNSIETKSDIGEIKHKSRHCNKTFGEYDFEELNCD